MDNLNHRLALALKNDLKSYKRNLECYNQEEIYNFSLDNIKNDRLLRARIDYTELSQKDISDKFPKIMINLIDSDLSLSSHDSDSNIIEHASDKSFYAMIESTSMYAQGDLSLENLLVVEKMVDNISKKLSTCTMKLRSEYNEFYLRFKEYVIDAFVSED